LFTLPTVHAVRENFPEARLHFLVSQEYAALSRELFRALLEEIQRLRLPTPMVG
jgi:hypothetical protein